jgi:2',3'-cyclic-nucleotide 2'-phosphodiesterase
MRVLFIGDVVGKPGREGLAATMPALREQHKPDLVIANGENVAGGVGITEETGRELFDCGVDVITLGNHAYRHREAYGFIASEERLIRPANYPESNPGKGQVIADAAGMRVAVLNLSGALYLRVDRNPFLMADEMVGQLSGKADAIVLDFHAELTSEKIAMGWHLDGRAAAVLGTHTHVATADARVLPGGTAYATDVGMTGAHSGVIGVRREQALEGFLTQMPVRFDSAEGDVWVKGALVEVGDDGLARGIEPVSVPAAGQ